MYATVRIFNGVGYKGTFLVPLLISALFGFVLGSFNAFIIHRFKLPTLIATLGTANLFNGILLTFLGSAQINSLPKGYSHFAKTYLLRVSSEYGVSSIPIAFVIWMLVAFIVWYILKYTVLGRGVYAIGGNRISAERIGLNISMIHWFIYATAGAIAGMAGTINTALKRTCNPFDAIGIELTIIAAVVLGGVKITGGKGSMLGTVLGVFMFTVINNSLIMMGVSTYWQRAVIGLLIILSTSITAIQDRRIARKLLKRT
jgi:simple sugar transport system permease protein